MVIWWKARLYRGDGPSEDGRPPPEWRGDACNTKVSRHSKFFDIAQWIAKKLAPDSFEEHQIKVRRIKNTI